MLQDAAPHLLHGDHICRELTRTFTGNCQMKEIAMAWACNMTHQPPEDDPAGHTGGQMLPWISVKSRMNNILK